MLPYFSLKMKSFILLENQSDLIKLTAIYLNQFSLTCTKEGYIVPLVISYLLDVPHRPGTMPDHGETEIALTVRVRIQLLKNIHRDQTGCAYKYSVYCRKKIHWSMGMHHSLRLPHRREPREQGGVSPRCPFGRVIPGHACCLSDEEPPTCT